jgi:CRP/FNR family transcriptional regulator, cyclic AMP receptor protein
MCACGWACPRRSSVRKLCVVTRGTQRYGFDLFENCQSCSWRGEGFFCQLPPQVLKDFDALTFTNIYPKGAILFAEGEPTRGIFQLCHGSVKLSMSSEDGKTLITRIVEEGEALGLSSTISGNPSRVTAETLVPSQVNFVRRDDFLRFINTSIAASSNALRQLATDCESSIALTRFAPACCCRGARTAAARPTRESAYRCS